MSGSLTLHAPPEPPLEDELLELELLLVDPDELLELELVLVSGFAASTGEAESVPASSLFDGAGSFTPGSVGVTLFSTGPPPNSSAGEVAHAEAAVMRAPSERTTAQVMAGRRMMASTLAAEVCRRLGRLRTETRR